MGRGRGVATLTVLRRLIGALALTSAAPVLAQPADIIVTGRGLGEALGDSVYDTVLIDRARLTGSASGRLEEILKEVPGFQLFRRTDARSANPTSQGATLRALGGNASSRALLVLDGVPQSDPFGGWISWPAYDPQRLGAVRVVRGGGSGANGAGALAGTIEMFTVTPAESEGASAALAYGSRDSIDAHAGVLTRIGKGHALVSAGYGRGDGFIPIIASQRGPADRPSPYEQASVALRGVVPLSAGVELQANGLWFSDDRERGTALSAITTRGTDASLRLVGNGAWRWSALAYVQKRDFTNSFASVNAARDAVVRVAEQYDVPSTGLGARFEVRPPVGSGVELRLGGDWRETVGETRELFNFQNGVGTRRRLAGGRTRTVGGFAEAALERGALTLTGGARIDRWFIRNGFLDERVIATGAVLNDLEFADRSGWQPTARAGLAVRPTDRLTLRSAAYLGWRLPTLHELYRPFRVGVDATAANPELSSERLRGAEVGIDYRPLPTARIGMTLFANRLDDAIANVTLGQGPGLFPGVGFVAAGGQYRQRRNLGAIKVHGVEIDGRIDLDRWSLSGGYSFVQPEVEASGAAAPLDGLRPAQTPRHSFASTLGWRSPKAIGGSLTMRYTSSQYEDDLNAQRLQGALTFDAAASLKLGRRFALALRGENLTDKRVPAAISGEGIIERATPRTLWIELRFGD